MVEVDGVKVPVTTKGVPEPLNIQVLFPASSVVDEEIVKTDETVIVPVPEFTVTVLGDPSLENVREENTQFVPAVVAPKDLFPPVACRVNVPPVKLIIPAPPVTSLFAVIVPLAEPLIVPVTVIAPVNVCAPVPVVYIALPATRVVPETFKIGLFVAAVRVNALDPLPMVKLLLTVIVWLPAVPRVWVTVAAGMSCKL